ncbi:MAG: hypothetical protein HPY52_16935 [Firmicutes bacterium]|nr:hypothetical protein [Bacillota bacterium]
MLEMSPPVAEEEMDPEIQALARESGSVVACFIAPYAGIRTSPRDEVYASIGLEEEFVVESLLERVRKEIPERKDRKLICLINTHGGGMASSYKIARALWVVFSKIRVFVPHIAASGGTIVALTGDEIVMGLMSQLGPLNVQTTYKGFPVSVNRSMECLRRYRELFRTMTPEEAPYPLRAMVDRLDPLLNEEWCGIAATGYAYVRDILGLAGYPKDKADKLALTLTKEFPSHGYVIHADMARDLGLPVKPSEQYPAEWDLMRRWLGRYLSQGAAHHHIKYALPVQTAVTLTATTSEGGQGGNKSEEGAVAESNEGNEDKERGGNHPKSGSRGRER